MATVSLGPGYNAEIARVCCGGYCSAAISTSGDLYMWGYAESHQLLDLPVPINTAKPRLVTKLGARSYQMPPPVVDERGRDLKIATADDTKVYRLERVYGTFTRRFALPTSVDSSKISAAYRNGVLEVTLPKADEAKERKVEIKVA